MYSYNPYYEQYLAHHGILGQRWGIRRYQPYPNGRKPVGAKEVGEANKVKAKTILKIAGITISAAAVGVGIYTLSKNPNALKSISKGSNFIQSSLDELENVSIERTNIERTNVERTNVERTNVERLTSASDLKTMPNESVQFAILKVNPDSGTMNCGSVALAVEARANGFDVVANGKENGATLESLAVYYEKLKDGDIPDSINLNGAKSMNDVKQMIINSDSNKSNYQRGIMSLKAKGRDNGHFINYEMKNGIVKFFDGQIGIEYTDTQLNRMSQILDFDRTRFLRTDNCSMDFDMLAKSGRIRNR